MNGSVVAIFCLLLCMTVLATDVFADGTAGQLLVHNGRDTRAAEVPWHAGIYEKVERSFSQLCGGTLVSSKVVVTAAHCFWDERRSVPRNNTDAYKVAIGKYHREWAVEDVGTQRMDIAGIFLHPRYRGRRRKHEYDVAVVQLEEEVRVTVTAQFAELDYNNLYESVQLTPGSVGIVTGWGITEEGRASDVLKSVELPYVDPIVCYDMLSEELQPMVTPDKFCAGYTSRNTSVCPGDSGGGLVFRRYDAATLQVTFYLRGVVSIAFKPAHNTDKCYAQQVTGFSGLSHDLTRKWLAEFPIANLTSMKRRVGANPDCGVDDAAGLVQAVRAGQLGKVQCLIENGAPALTPDPATGAAAADTALLQAGEWGNMDVLRFLLARGANPAAKNSAGQVAVDMALLKAAEWGQLENAQMLIQNYSANPNARHAGGTTPLLLASNVGNLNLVQYLIDQGADPAFKYRDTDRAVDIALLKAAEWGQLDVVRYLLEKGADPGYSDKQGFKAGNLALWKAAEWGRTDTARLLTLPPYSVDPTVKNKDGKTALDVARASAAGGPVATYLENL